MASEYWKRIAERVRTFAKPEDPLQCVKIGRSSTPATCELCGHSPIFWLHYLKNLRTGKQLIVGSQCILNYKLVYEKTIGKKLVIHVDKHLEAWANKINKKIPGAITVIDNRTNDRIEWKKDLEEEYDIEDEDLEEELQDSDPDDRAPEGLGLDEIDWDAE